MILGTVAILNIRIDGLRMVPAEAAVLYFPRGGSLGELLNRSNRSPVVAPNFGIPGTSKAPVECRGTRFDYVPASENRLTLQATIQQWHDSETPSQ